MIQVLSVLLCHSYYTIILRAETGLQHHDDILLHKKEKLGLEDRIFFSKYDSESYISFI